MFGASEELSLNHLQNNGMEFVYSGCSVAAQPVEILIRWSFGTRYYPVPVSVFSMAMMIILPGILSLFNNFMQMIPLLHVQPQIGMFSLGDFARLYYLAMAVHGVRLWRRMIDPSRELHSRFEGSALGIFSMLPKGTKFWWVRLLWEPVLVFLLSVSLQDLFIIQAPLALYLRLAALALFAKSYIAWLRDYEVNRDVLDGVNSGPAMERLMQNKATDEDRAMYHIARLPDDLPPDVRSIATQRIVREHFPELPGLNRKGDHHEAH